MPIRRGEDWGEPGGLGSGGVLVGGDGEARTLIEDARRANRPLPELGLLGGDLCRTLGGRGDPDALRSPEAWRFAVDVGAVLLDAGCSGSAPTWWPGREGGPVRRWWS